MAERGPGLTPSDETLGPVRRIVLVGFMGAGKTAVGRELAQRLDWSWVDTDAEVERRAGMSVSEIFRTAGEPRFREMEADATEEALLRAGVVISTGGGWAEAPGRMESLPPETLTVWLDAPLDELMRRVGDSVGVRPLLSARDRFTEAQSLLERRVPRYARARIRLDTVEKTPASLAEELIGRVGARRSTHLEAI